MPETLATATEAEAVLAEADLLWSAEAVNLAVDAMAERITERLAGDHPVIMSVLNGGLIPTAWLVTRLRFPLEMGYLHATRYRGGLRGEELDWRVPPSVPVEGRTVLVVDDIFDEGHTLAAVVEDLRARDAREVLSAVLVDKQHGRKVPGFQLDFKALDVEDRYVFGCGMDYKECLRNLPGIYALAREAAT
jgi:hypoxanthine phosphoribosyltransferase